MQTYKCLFGGRRADEHCVNLTPHPLLPQVKCGSTTYVSIVRARAGNGLFNVVCANLKLRQKICLNIMRYLKRKKQIFV